MQTATLITAGMRSNPANPILISTAPPHHRAGAGYESLKEEPVVNLTPDMFNIPPDTIARFYALLKYYRLKPIEVGRRPSDPADTYGEAKTQLLPVSEPRWMLWCQNADCRRA